MITLKDAKTVARSVAEAVRPVSIVLFGSVAREGSGVDLDLLIVTDDRAARTDDPHLQVHRCLKRFYKKFSIDPFVMPLKVFREHYARGSPFLQLIMREGRVLYMKDAVREWIRQSEEELGMAAYLLEGGYFKGACYHAQQSIEKSVKSMLLSKGWPLEKTHSLERLVAVGKDYRVRLPLSDEEIVFVDNIYRGRYPAEAGLLPLGEPSKADAERALRIAKRVLESARTALGK